MNRAHQPIKLVRRASRRNMVAASSELLTLAEAAAMLRLHESTLRKRRAGTDALTQIRQGKSHANSRHNRQRIFYLRSEVEAHIAALVAEGQGTNTRALELVWERA